MARSLAASLSLCLLTAACGSDDHSPSGPADAASGGVSASSGGASGAGGKAAATGGAANGGALATGGATTGGASGTGGGPSSSGGAPSGGAGAGGSADTGGASSAGGSGSTGGASSAGGSANTGGASSERSACKRGVAYGFDPAGGAADLGALAPGVTWFYNWASSPPRTVAADFERLGVEFVPMLWNGNFTVEDAVKKIPASAKYLLGFNEPNFHSQANMTPAQAAARWPDVEAVAARRNLEIVSPAVNFCGGGCNVTNPVDWMDQFFAACQGCKIDYVAIHWYACDGPALTWYLNQFRKYDRPIWLTEFSCADQGVQPVSKQQSYMKAALEILEGDPDVFRYAWFAGRADNVANVDLLGATGALTALGSDYVSLPADAACRR